jgi:hypothetical protein
MSKQSRIPVFKSYEEEAEFWDTHSVTEFLDELKPVKVVYKPEGKKTKKSGRKHDTVIHIKISEKVKQLLDQRAKAQASTISALLRLWVHQKLAESTRSLSTDQ